MTNHPSDNNSDRHDDIHPGQEGDLPVDRRGSGDKIAEPQSQTSETPSQDQKEQHQPRDLYPPAEPEETTPDVKQGEELSCAPYRELHAEEELRAEENSSSEDTPSSTEQPAPRAEAECPKADAAENADTAEGAADDSAGTAGKQTDSDEAQDSEDDEDDEEDEDDDEEEDDEDDEDGEIDFTDMLFGSKRGALKRLVLPEGKKGFPFSFPFFMRLKSTETLCLNTSIKTLPERIFTAAESLRSIEVPDENPHFRSIDGVLYSKDGKTLLCYPRMKADRDFSVPEPVEIVAKCAFFRCKRLRSLNFPNTLRSLETRAIVECPNLREIQFPRLIETIHPRAIMKVESLERLEVLGTLSPAEAPRPAGEIQAEENAPAQERYRSVDGVLYSSDMKRLVLYPGGRDDSHFDVPETVEVIGRGAFLSSAYLQSIHLGASVREIELLCEPTDTPCLKNATLFYGCARLKSFHVDPANPVFRAVDGVLCKNDARVLVSYPLAKRDGTFRIPDSVEMIAPYAFATNKHLERVIFPNSVRTIEQGAFLVCENLREFLLPDSLRSMGDRAFAGCKSLVKIRIPKSVQGFDRCFDNCPSVRRIDVDPENPFFRSNCGVLFSKDLSHLILCPAAWPRKSAVVPEQVTTIEAGAFEDCRVLRSIKVPAAVRVIEEDAFRGFNPFFRGSEQTIYAEEGSAARDYAKQNNIKAADIGDFPEEDFFG